MKGRFKPGPAAWPRLDLPVRPPYPLMEALRAERLPAQGDWQFEPKWDGFRCLAFKDGDQVALQSKAGQPLGRYFPEMVQAVGALAAPKVVLDGELVIPVAGGLSFDHLLLRIHPAASRIRRLAQTTPAVLIAFDLLVAERGRDLTGLTLVERRLRLERLARDFGPASALRLSPATSEPQVALRWLGTPGLDGIMAKRAGAPYRSGERDGMIKVKPEKTADCVVGGFRWAADSRRGVGSLLLGLFDAEGLLDHVGFCAAFDEPARHELVSVLAPYRGGSGFTGRTPGGPSRWSDRSGEYEPLRPERVVEVGFDHFSGGRFRHGTRFLRWRPDKAPGQCTFDQLAPARLELAATPLPPAP